MATRRLCNATQHQIENANAVPRYERALGGQVNRLENNSLKPSAQFEMASLSLPKHGRDLACKSKFRLFKGSYYGNVCRRIQLQDLTQQSSLCTGDQGKDGGEMRAKQGEVS